MIQKKPNGFISQENGRLKEERLKTFLNFRENLLVDEENFQSFDIDRIPGPYELY